jgi:predicted TIM-barrel fold metal-dependent hydrolase
MTDSVVHRMRMRCSCCEDNLSTPRSVSRRRVMSGFAAVGVSTTASLVGFHNTTSAQAMAVAASPLIDVHHHFVPPFYLAENRDRLAFNPGGRISPAWLEWEPRKTLEAMDEHGVETAVLSLSTPGVWFGDANAASRTARRVNDYAADLARSHPHRFGLFSALPLPDTDGSLREIEYAFDTLKADGVGLLTSYDGKWLGDPAYQPVFEELDRRKAVVFVHPTVPNCCQALVPGVSPIMAEVPQDTTRTVISLLFSGALTRFKNIRFIFCHAGGSVPVVAARMMQYASKEALAKLPHGVDYELRRHYYDIAVGGHRPAISALTSYVPISQILFGSDFPYRPLGESADSLPQMGFTDTQLSAVKRDNAYALLPRLKHA